MASQALTPMQKELLKMFSFDHIDEFVMEIKSIRRLSSKEN